MRRNVILNMQNTKNEKWNWTKTLHEITAQTGRAGTKQKKILDQVWCVPLVFCIRHCLPFFCLTSVPPSVLPSSVHSVLPSFRSSFHLSLFLAFTFPSLPSFTCSIPFLSFFLPFFLFSILVDPMCAKRVHKAYKLAAKAQHARKPEPAKEATIWKTKCLWKLVECFKTSHRGSGFMVGL